jgi:hypothetical protein
MKSFGYLLLKIVAIILVVIGAVFLFGAILGFSKSGSIQASSIFLAIGGSSLAAGMWLSKYAVSLREIEEPNCISVGNKYTSEYPEKWAEIFSIIEKAGGVKMPLFKELTKSEKSKVRMNWVAFFLGPFYYLALGMWRPVVTYLISMVIFYAVIDYVALTYFGKENIKASGVAAGFIWGMLANVNYYKLKVLGEKNWF